MAADLKMGMRVEAMRKDEGFVPCMYEGEITGLLDDTVQVEIPAWPQPRWVEREDFETLFKILGD